MEISVSSVTVWHHEALLGIMRLCQVMPNRDPGDGNFCPHRTTSIDTFHCIPFIYLFTFFNVIKCIRCIGFVITRPW